MKKKKNNSLFNIYIWLYVFHVLNELIQKIYILFSQHYKKKNI